MVFRTLSRLNAVKRVPLIKFRKGGNLSTPGGAATDASRQASASSSPTASRTQGAASSGAAIEDWELPPRYWRKPIDPVEEEYINRGGPA